MESDKKQMKKINETQEAYKDVGSKDTGEDISLLNESINQEANDSQTCEDEQAEEKTEAVLKLEALETLAAENLDKYQRTLAEFDNFRKRTAKEKAIMYSDGASDVIKSLLPVFDSFERAFASTTEADTKTAVYTGLSLIYKQLQKFMEDNSIAEIKSVGESFDPELHQAIAHVEDSAYGQNEVIEEMQKGYTLKGKVIRHSMVKVAN